MKYLVELYTRMTPFLIYFIIIGSSMILSIFNITTISVLLLCKDLRRKHSTYPLLSLLFACLLQALTAAPSFVFKELVKGTGK